LIQPTDPYDRPGLDGDQCGQHGVLVDATPRRQVFSPTMIPASMCLNRIALRCPSRKLMIQLMSQCGRDTRVSTLGLEMAVCAKVIRDASALTLWMRTS
jgi:hypothetical protein